MLKIATLKISIVLFFNLFRATDFFWYPLKTSENQVFWCFQVVSKEISGMEWINDRNPVLLKFSYDALSRKYS